MPWALQVSGMEFFKTMNRQSCNGKVGEQLPACLEHVQRGPREGEIRREKGGGRLEVLHRGPRDGQLVQWSWTMSWTPAPRRLPLPRGKGGVSSSLTALRGWFDSNPGLPLGGQHS
uniref:Uncharacterized protein n=1 Tax=Opuntia streptacantha TaxID=393608 RepID=A0A7C9CZD1_OPUST